jgi:DNA polymerase-3 subunit gamma/tau
VIPLGASLLGSGLMSGVVAETFQSLYRRYRPQRFSELRGQPHVVMALSHAVRDDRVTHAYLFSGPRGTGKTSTARILAKALNCANPQEGEPCDVCDSCVDIAKGVSLDVHELDAASNNGVDAMRDLVARASLATPGKWKVYIVDEVHMLSTAAANALLKTLEEPPGHVVFVLATTDPQKVLPTIKSRTQHFEFHLLDAEVLQGLLTDIAGDAELDLPDDGIESAVRRGHGSARDALSALDQVAAAGVVTDESAHVAQLIAALAEADTSKALAVVAEAMVAGSDAPRLAGELIEGLRGVFLGAVAPATSGAVRGPDGRPVLGPARSVRALEVIGQAIVDMREALDARTCFEVALVRLTHPEVDDSPQALVDRLERLERRVADLSGGGSAAPVAPLASTAAPAMRGSGDAQQHPETSAPSAVAAGAAGSPALGAFRRQPAGQPPSPPSASPTPAATSAAGAPEPAEAADTSTATQHSAPPAAPAGASTTPMPSRDDLVTAWGDHILASLRARVRAVLQEGRFVATEGDTAVYALGNAAHIPYAEPVRQEVGEILSQYFKRPIRLRLVTEAEFAAAGPVAGGPTGSPAPTAAQPSEPSKASTATGRASSPRDSRSPAPPVESDPYEDMDVDEIAPGEIKGNHDPVSWAATRLLEAFPGAEEVP